MDLTQPLNEETPILTLPEEFGQTIPFKKKEISKYDEKGPGWYWNNFETGEHTGTHLDVPAHIIHNGKKLNDFPLSSFTGCLVRVDEKTFNNLDAVREKIDGIDEEMFSLLVKRQKCIEIAALIKNDRSKVFDEGRIEDVVNKVKKLSVSLGLSLAIAEPLWRKLINLSIEHEFSEFDKKLNK